MNAVKQDIEALVQKELDAANERYPLFASPHEGYAVIKEEYEELEEFRFHIGDYVKILWGDIRFDMPVKSLGHLIDNIYGLAVSAACEAVQVAAMCEKWRMSAEKWGDN